MRHSKAANWAVPGICALMALLSLAGLLRPQVGSYDHLRYAGSGISFVLVAVLWHVAGRVQQDTRLDPIRRNKRVTLIRFGSVVCLALALLIAY